MWKVRRIVAFACTSCYSLFPTSSQAKQHARDAHPAAPPKPRGRPRSTQTGAILQAIGGGASTAAEVSKKTKIPLERVHSLLSYHRARGNVKGFSGKLKLAR